MERNASGFLGERNGSHSNAFVMMSSDKNISFEGDDSKKIELSKKSLAESEGRYRTLVELSPDPIAIHCEGKLVYINKAGISLIGAKSAKEILGRPVLDFVHPHSLPVVLQRFEQLAKGAQKLEPIHERFIKVTGEVIDVEVSAIPIMWEGKKAAQVFIRDITELKKQEKIQTTTLKVLQTANTDCTMLELIDFIRSAVGEIMSVKNFYIALCDEKRETLSFPYFVDEFDENPQQRKFKDGLTEYVIKTGKSYLLTDEEINGLAEKGEIDLIGSASKIWLGVPLKIQEKIIGIIVVQDYAKENIYSGKDKEMLEIISFPISTAIERSRVEEERKRYIQVLKELNTTKDKFFSIISHDLRGPFNSILGFTEILKNEFSELNKEEMEEYINMVYKSSRNIYDLLNDLLQYSKFQTGKMEFNPSSLNLKWIVETSAAVMDGNAARKKITVEHNINHDLFVFADEDMLSSVFQNLLSNAIKFTHQRGKVEINAVKKESYIEVSVKDNGIGINSEIAKNLFKLQSKISTPGTDQEQGSGLGLILTKEFVEKNNGTIRFKSNLNKGTEFILTLPFSEES